MDTSGCGRRIFSAPTRWQLSDALRTSHNDAVSGLRCHMLVGPRPLPYSPPTPRIADEIKKDKKEP